MTSRRISVVVPGAAPRRSWSTRTVLGLVMALVAGITLTAAPTAVAAQEPNQVTGLTVDQRHGYARLAWDAVPLATDYQIERTPVDADIAPTGASVIAGLWRPNRTVTQLLPTFADAGFNPGDRFAWRVRARLGTTAQPWSDSVAGTTLPPWGDPSAPGQSLQTQWERTLAAQYTSDVDEYASTAALDEGSDRVRVWSSDGPSTAGRSTCS